MRIELFDEDASGLIRNRWIYSASIGYGPDSSLSFRLDLWQREARATRRHKWARDGNGWVWRHHNSCHNFDMQIPAAAVPEPANLLERMQKAILERLSIAGPFDPKG